MQTRPLYRNLKFANNFDSVTTEDGLKALVDALYNSDKLLGFDIETGYSGAAYKDRSTNVYHPYQYTVGFSITNDPTWARYVPLRHDYGPNLDPNFVWEYIKPLLEEKPLVAHNALFEAENLLALDIKGDGPSIDIFKSTVYDSMIEAYVLSDVPAMPVDGSQQEGELVQRFIPPFHQTPDGFQKPEIKTFRVGLKSLTKFRYNYDQAEIHSLFQTDKPLTAKEKDMIRFNTLPVSPQVVHYACDDAYLSLQLHHDQFERINEDPFLPNVYNLEMEICELLSSMRPIGINVDWEGINTHLNMFENFLHEMKVSTKMKFEKETGRNLIDLNLSSPKQIGNLIYGSEEEGGLAMEITRTTETGAASTDETALTTLRKVSPAIDSLLKYRQCDKMGKWFQLWAPLREQSEDQRLHPSFMQTRIQSGRFASANPNIQNVTKRWWYQNIEGSVAEVMKNGVLGKDYWTGNARDFITASPGYTLVSYDYKSAEVQMMAALAGEQTIIDAFYSGEDFHKWTASVVFGKPIEEVTKVERQRAKAVTFGLAYQQGVNGLAGQLGISKDEAQEIMNMYFSRFPKLQAYFDKQKELVATTNEVRTWFGRKATIWESMHARRAVKSAADRLAVNLPVQGGATGDYTKLAMVRVYRELKERGWWNEEVRLLMNQHDSLVFEVRNSLDMDEVIAILTPLVQFNLQGIQGCYDQFESFPPMSVDWEVGPNWGSVADVEDGYVFNASALEVALHDDATSEDLSAVIDVLATNPGDTPITLSYKGSEIPSKFSVKLHPDVLSKLKGGDPDVGINHKAGDMVEARFV